MGSAEGRTAALSAEPGDGIAAEIEALRKGRYDVPSFFSPAGIYGGWRWTAIVPYLIALAAQVPFLDQTLYTGPMVKVLGGPASPGSSASWSRALATWWPAGWPRPRWSRPSRKSGIQ